MELDSSPAAAAVDARTRGGPKSLFDAYDRRGCSRLPDGEFREREGARAWFAAWGAILSPWVGLVAFLGSCSVLVASKSGNEVVFTGDRLRRVERDYQTADSVARSEFQAADAILHHRIDSLSVKVDSANKGIERLITITCAQRQSSVAAVVEKCYPDAGRKGR